MSVEVVQQVKAELEARGVDLSGPCGAFAIASRVAWRLRDTGLGLNHQDANRTHCPAHGGTWSPDFLIYPDGLAVDCLGDGGGANTPQWSLKTGDPARWRAPFNPDAGAEPLPPAQPPVVVPTECKAQAVDLAPLVAELAALRQEVRDLRDKPGPAIEPPDVEFPVYEGTLSIPLVGTRTITLRPK